MNATKLRAYAEYVLQREIVGPVLSVFALYGNFRRRV